jgi:hypothetical protein
MGMDEIKRAISDSRRSVQQNVSPVFTDVLLLCDALDKLTSDLAHERGAAQELRALKDELAENYHGVCRERDRLLAKCRKELEKEQ